MRDFLSTVRDQFLLLLPPSTAVGVPTLVTRIGGDVTKVIEDALRLRDRLLVASCADGYEVFLPAAGEPFDSAYMHRVENTRVCGKVLFDGPQKLQVLAVMQFGFKRVRQARSDALCANDTPLRPAHVICTWV